MSGTGKKDTIPCCAADAMQEIRTVDVDGVSVGLAMLDAIFEEVDTLIPLPDDRLKQELLKRVRIYNYIPRNVEDAYAEAILNEYKKGENHGKD